MIVTHQVPAYPQQGHAPASAVQNITLSLPQLSHRIGLGIF